MSMIAGMKDFQISLAERAMHQNGINRNLARAVEDLRSFYYREVDAVCQKSHIDRCMCRKCIEERADAALKLAGVTG